MLVWGRVTDFSVTTLNCPLPMARRARGEIFDRYGLGLGSWACRGRWVLGLGPAGEAGSWVLGSEPKTRATGQSIRLSRVTRSAGVVQVAPAPGTPATALVGFLHTHRSTVTAQRKQKSRFVAFGNYCPTLFACKLSALLPLTKPNS